VVLEIAVAKILEAQTVADPSGFGDEFRGEHWGSGAVVRANARRGREEGPSSRPSQSSLASVRETP
jgi:hypothetical protein